jgi:hypothetical protein
LTLLATASTPLPVQVTGVPTPAFPLSPEWTTAIFTGVAGAGTLFAVAVSLYVAGWLAPRLAERAARDAEDRLRRRADEAEDRRFRAACLLVYDELRDNLAELTTLEKQDRRVGVKAPTLASEAYSEYKLLLATHLSQDSRDSVRAAYRHVRRPEAFVHMRGAPELGHPLVGEPVPDLIRAAIKATERGCMVLTEEAKKLPGGYRDL